MDKLPTKSVKKSYGMPVLMVLLAGCSVHSVRAAAGAYGFPGMTPWNVFSTAVSDAGQHEEGSRPQVYAEAWGHLESVQSPASLLSEERKGDESGMKTDAYRRMNEAAVALDLRLLQYFMKSDLARFAAGGITRANGTRDTLMHAVVRAADDDDSEAAKCLTVLLASEHVDPNTVAKVGLDDDITPLRQAVRKGCAQLVALMLASDRIADETIAEVYGQRGTLLHEAVGRDDAEVARALLASNRYPRELVNTACGPQEPPLTAYQRAVGGGRHGVLPELEASDKVDR